MKKRFAMAIIATITFVALVKITFAEDPSSFAGDMPKVSPLPDDPSTIMIQMDADPSKQQKREVPLGTPRVMQPYTIVQAHPYRLPTASYPTRPARPKGQNCVKEFLINQLRETNDNINRLLECIKKNQNCAPNEPELNSDVPMNPPPPRTDPKPCQPCQTEIERLIIKPAPTPKPAPCEDIQPPSKPSTPSKLITFRREYIKEESEEVDTNRYSSAKRFPSNSCEEEEQSQEELTTTTTPKPKPKPTRKRCSKPPPTTSKCRTSRKPKVTTTTAPPTRKPPTKECQCVFCVEDGTCAGGYE